MSYYNYNKYKKKKIDYTRPTLHNPDYVAYTDGACWKEKYGTSIGRGGYGTIIIKTGGEDFKGIEYSEGYILTTNNRMELLAVIVALRNVPEGSKVRIYSDSQYVIKIMRDKNDYHQNHDLWREYHNLLWERDLEVDPVWVKGHNGNTNNERCDKLAKRACHSENLLHDEWYENQQKSYALQTEVEIPEKYKKRNVEQETRECLISNNHVNEQCADAILEFWSSENPMEDEFGKLKTFGKDYWSEYSYEWFEENCDREILDIIEEEFDDIATRAKCIKWYMRGLSLDEAIIKAAYDFETFQLKRWN